MNQPLPVRRVVREFAPKSWIVIGLYVFLMVILLYESLVSNYSTVPYIAEILAAILAVYLARYLSTNYTLTPNRLKALRLFGSRSLKLKEVRKIEIGNLRDLGPVSLFPGWGWRGRMWSPLIGKFDSVYTTSAGLLVSAGNVPLFISPKDPLSFARELSRRVRSAGGELLTDDSRPSERAPA